MARRILLRLFAALALVLLIAVAALAIWARYSGQAWLHRTVHDRLVELVGRTTVDGYHLEVGELTTDLNSGDVRIADLRLYFDSTLTDSLKSGAFKYLFAAEANGIELRGLSFWRLVLFRELHVRKLELDEPLLHYFIGNEHVSLAAPFKRLKNNVRRPLSLLSIDSIVVRGAQAQVRDLADRLPVMHASGLGAEIANVRISQAAGHRRVDLEVGDVLLRLDSLSTEVSANYRLRLGRIRLSDRTRHGSAEKIHLEHIATATVEPQQEFRNTEMDIHADSLTMEGIDIGSLLAEQSLYMTLLQVHGLQFDGRLDQNLPLRNTDYKPLPPAALMTLRFPVRIDTLQLVEGDITYSERSNATLEWGTLSFKRMNATFTGINNVDDTSEERPPIDGTLHCMFMDTAVFNAHYSAPADSSGRFTLEVSAGELPLTQLNVVTTPLLRLTVNEGRMHTLRLTMKANDNRAKCNMQLSYSGLHASVAEGASKQQRHGMFGDLIDHALSPSNGGGLTDEQKRSYVVEREKDRSIFNYIWHVTRTGLARDLLPGVRERVGTLLKKERAERVQRREQRRSQH